MTSKLGVVMDPIAKINYKKDSTLAMLWAAQARDWQLFYMEQTDLYLEQGVAGARMAPLTVFHDPDSWYAAGAAQDRELAELDVILMRKDPPFDNEFIYSTYIWKRRSAGAPWSSTAARACATATRKFSPPSFPSAAHRCW